MNQDGLVNLAIVVHAAVLSAALVAWYKYGDRTDVFSRSLAGVESTLTRLRISIADDLLDCLKETLSPVPMDPQPVLAPDGRPALYSERATNFLASERFREAVRGFADLRTEALADFQALLRARNGWCFWARILSWAILLVIVIQILGLLLHGFIGRIIDAAIPEWTVHASLALTAFSVLMIFCLPFPMLLRSHDTILQKRVKYNAP